MYRFAGLCRGWTRGETNACDIGRSVQGPLEAGRLRPPQRCKGDRNDDELATGSGIRAQSQSYVLRNSDFAATHAHDENQVSYPQKCEPRQIYAHQSKPGYQAARKPDLLHRNSAPRDLMIDFVGREAPLTATGGRVPVIRRDHWLHSNLHFLFRTDNTKAR